VSLEDQAVVSILRLTRRYRVSVLTGLALPICLLPPEMSSHKNIVRKTTAPRRELGVVRVKQIACRVIELFSRSAYTARRQIVTTFIGEPVPGPELERVLNRLERLDSDFV
jgi:hypothetical protein